MKKTFAALAAATCVTVVAALAVPHGGAPAYQYGLTGNAWWAGLSHSRPADAAATGSPTFQYGLVDNEWWAAHARRNSPAR